MALDAHNGGLEIYRPVNAESHHLDGDRIRIRALIHIQLKILIRIRARIRIKVSIKVIRYESQDHAGSN